MNGITNTPPPRGSIPVAWYDRALLSAGQGARHARSCARAMEVALDSPFDDQLRAEVSRLATWLRSIR